MQIIFSLQFCAGYLHIFLKEVGWTPFTVVGTLLWPIGNPNQALGVAKLHVHALNPARGGCFPL